jgi:hypothetical protein
MTRGSRPYEHSITARIRVASAIRLISTPAGISFLPVCALTWLMKPCSAEQAVAVSSAARAPCADVDDGHGKLAGALVARLVDGCVSDRRRAQGEDLARFMAGGDTGEYAIVARCRWRPGDGLLTRTRATRRLQRSQPMVQGSFYLQKRRCGKPNCACACGELHAAWVIARSEGGKNRTYMVPVEERARLRQLTDEYRRYLLQERRPLFRIDSPLFLSQATAG